MDIDIMNVSSLDELEKFINERLARITQLDYQAFTETCPDDDLFKGVFMGRLEALKLLYGFEFAFDPENKEAPIKIVRK